MPENRCRTGTGYWMSKIEEPFDNNEFFAISPLMIFPRALGRFKVFIRQAGRYVLYAKENEHFTERHRKKLHESGVTEVYVQSEQRQDYQVYVERHLPQILADEVIPLDERTKVLRTAATAIVQDVFDNKLPTGMTKREYARILNFVEKATVFLARDEALKQIASLVSHDYTIYSHSVQVFVYVTAILQALKAPEGLIVEAGVGAMLHDLGKMAIDKVLLHKPGPLTQEERRQIETHPARGLAFCMDMPITPAVTACILFHHERLDGSGYPGGLSGESIPMHVRALAVADTYDAMTTRRSYAEVFTPFEALRIMRDDMSGSFDPDAFRTLVMVLSGAHII